MMLDLKIKSGRRYVAPADLVRVLGAERALTELGEMVEALIAQIDMLAGDADMEETAAEDSFAPPAYAVRFADGPGCVLSDSGEYAGDETDASWSEWSGRRKRSAKAYLHEPIGYHPSGRAAHEDEEEDDPSGQCDEDGINTSHEAAYARAAGCPISDPDHEGEGHGGTDEGPLPVLSWGEDQTSPIVPDLDADRRIMREHRDRIRAKSYTPVPSQWRGDPPTYAKAVPGIVGNLAPVTAPRLRLVSSRD